MLIYRVPPSGLTSSASSDSWRWILQLVQGQPTTPVEGTGSVSVVIDPSAPWTRVDLSVSGGKLYLDSGLYLSGNKLYEVSAKERVYQPLMFTDNDDDIPNATA